MRKPIHQPLGEGLRTYCWLAFSLSLTTLSAQQCPYIVNCPQSTPTYCDESTNDESLWNYAPFTYSPTIGNADLHEASLDLNLKIKGCNGGGLATVSFLLYLDLDNDGLQETVIASGNPPPAGRVMANNSFNPGYSGGDTVLFDYRPLPDSMLYRFALEITYSGDTTIGSVRFSTNAAPYDFVPVILPEGRHRIEWRAAQDGIERFCDRNFKIKDCKKPNITCKTGMAVYLDVMQSAMVPLSAVLDAVSDNITPDTQLVLGMRRVGDGFGFPLDDAGNPQDTVMFNCSTGEDQLVELWVQDKVGNLENCVASILVYDTAGVCPILSLPSICARNYWNGQVIQDVVFSTEWVVPNQPPFVQTLNAYLEGCAELNTLPPANHFTLSAEKDTLPLNGVTTFDLVLISKHILALEPFDVGWKLTAADVNMSNSVTTFDILELRKLILGLTNKLPNNTPSWRFFVDTCTVWGNPYFGDCPDAYSLLLQPISAYPTNLSFKGVKVGDVNGTASNVDTLQGAAEARGSDIWLELPDRSLKAGETLELPLSVPEGGQWEGVQFSMTYDPYVLEIESVVSNGAIALGADNWARPEPGILNLSWSEVGAKPVLPGDALLYLRIKSHTDTRLSDALGLSNNGRMAAEAYDEVGIRHPLQLAFVEKTNNPHSTQAQIFNPMPNPTKGGASIPLRLSATETVSIEISDLAGKSVWRQTLALDAGAHFLDIPASAMEQSGLYLWRVCAGNVVESGRLMRL